MRTHIARLVLAVTLASPAVAFGQTRTAAPPQGALNPSGAAAPVRDDWQRAPDIFAALGAKPGSRIADLGAGEGWLSVRLARHVGPSGRVFASDISDAALGALADKLAKDTLRNIELVLAEDDDPRLPFGTLDGVVILNAYHEMPKRVPVLEGVKRALKPGGILVIVDNAPVDSLQAMSRKEQTSHHALAIDFARDDLEAQGFEIVRTDPKFIDRKMADHWQRQWLIVARRSAR